MADSKIKVAIRSRPLLSNEVEAAEPLEFHNGTVVKTSNKSFNYDYVFPPEVTNESVYKLAVADKIQHIFNGYNVTILAYGSTGSGKTYTMGTDYNPRTNSDSDLGIIPRGITEIFRVIEQEKDLKDFSVTVTFLELYREIVYDLLSPGDIKQCLVREDPADGNFQVPELTKMNVGSIAEAFDILTKGSNIRHTSATAKNVKSSRSHAIFSVYVETTDKTTLDFQRAKFQLVDLAGSERMASSKTKGVQVKEGININLGLLSLGKVIFALCEEKKHVPYRESNLTKLLQDSLGGSSHTVMIACINPSSTSVEETMSTLRYASNTRKIKNRPVVNKDPPAVEVEKLRKQVQLLKAALEKQQPATLISDTKSARMLESAYAKIGVLNHKLFELEETNTNITEKLKSFYEFIKTIVSELTNQTAGSFEWLQNHVEKLEQIQSDCLQIIVRRNLHASEVSDVSSQDNKTGDSEESCKSILPSEVEIESSDFEGHFSTTELTLESEQLLIEDFVQEQKSNASNLDNVQKALDMKEDMARHMFDILQTIESGGDEEREKELTKQLQILTKEKKDLQLSLGKTEKYSKEMQEKVDKYEAQIKSLEDQLRRNTKCIQVKKESQAKMDFLQREIQSLKKCKVQIIKQMKENSNKHMRVQRQKDKDIAKLERESRKKDVEITKMQTKFANQMRVLQSKVGQASASKTKLLRALHKKKPGQGGVMAKQSQESLNEWIEEEMKIVVDNGLVKIEIDSLENLANILQENIKNLDELSSADEKEEQPSEVGKLNAELQSIREQIAEMTKQNTEERMTKPCIILDGITDLKEAKHVIEFLFNKAVASQLEAAKEQQISGDKLRQILSNNEAFEETIKTLEKDIQTERDEMKKFKFDKDKEMIALKYTHDSKMLEYMMEMQSTTKEKLMPSSVEPTIAKRMEMQEKEIQQLQDLRAMYESKCAEVDRLHREFLKINKGNTSKWLSDLSNLPKIQVILPKIQEFQSPKRSLDDYLCPDPEEGENKSMMEEYLCDESFSNDQNDPDWRLTPLHKQAKKARFEKKTIQPASTNDGAGTSKMECESVIIDSSPDSESAKKTDCDCAGLCKTMRCGCKKRGQHCSDSCTCDRVKCLNMKDEDKAQGGRGLPPSDQTTSSTS